MYESIGAGDERAAVLTAVAPSSTPVRLRAGEGFEENLRRLLGPLGDGVVRSTRAYTDVLRTSAPAADAATRIDRIAALERARAVLAAAQLAEELAFAEQQRAEQVAAGVPAARLGRGVAEQIGFARRISPVAASRHVGLAVTLRDRLPQAWKQLWAGEASEDQVSILANRTSHLSEVDALIVDAGISPRMAGWNKKQTEQAADRAAYQIDPRGLIARRSAAEKDRRVWVRPGKDGMANLGASLPLAQGVQVYATLRKAAEQIRGVGGEERSLNQIMADLLVTAVTGAEQAHLVPVTVTVTITADALFNDGVEPAILGGIGPVPAEHARAIITGQPPASGPPDNTTPGRSGRSTSGAAPPDECFCETPNPDIDVTAREFKRAKAWLRRVLVDPITGVAVNLDSRKREFDGILRRFLTIRDRVCRHAYCGSSIRHADHIRPYRDGGTTCINNGQGLCESGNYAKDIPGWHTRAGDQPGQIIVTTPTGHQYATRPPHQTGMPGTATALGQRSYPGDVL
jgi:hypothetical protein